MPDTENEELIAAAEFIQSEMRTGFLHPGVVALGSRAREALTALVAAALASRPPVPVTPHPALEDLERAIHAGMAPNLMTIAGAIGSQEHYNEFLRGIAVSVAALLKGGSEC